MANSDNAPSNTPQSDDKPSAGEKPAVRKSPRLSGSAEQGRLADVAQTKLQAFDTAHEGQALSEREQAARKLIEEEIQSKKSAQAKLEQNERRETARKNARDQVKAAQKAAELAQKEAKEAARAAAETARQSATTTTHPDGTKTTHYDPVPAKGGDATNPHRVGLNKGSGSGTATRVMQASGGVLRAVPFFNAADGGINYIGNLQVATDLIAEAAMKTKGFPPLKEDAIKEFSHLYAQGKLTLSLSLGASKEQVARDIAQWGQKHHISPEAMTVLQGSLLDLSQEQYNNLMNDPSGRMASANQPPATDPRMQSAVAQATNHRLSSPMQVALADTTSTPLGGESGQTNNRTLG